MSSLVSRRLSSSRVGRVRSAAAGRSGARRTLHNNSGDMRQQMNPGHSDVGRSRLLKSAVAVATLSAFAGTWHFGKDAHHQSACKVTCEEDIDEVTAGKEAMNVGGMKEATNNGDNFSLEKYLDEMTELAAAQKRARYEREMSDKKATDEVTHREAMTREEMEDEAAMKARFEDWMKDYGRRYKNEEEKARRYELFKAFAKMVDNANSKGTGAVFVTNHTADWTEEECRCLYDDDVDWDDYLDHIKSLIAKKRALDKKRGV